MSTKEVQQEILANMKRWQKIENASIASTGNIIEKTDNPIVRIIMEIIQRDSQMHYRVQEFIASTLEGKAVVLSPEEVAKVWSMIEHHIELENQTIKLAESALSALRGKKMLVQEYLLDYLLIDERKHSEILKNLEQIKKGMYPYA